MFNPNERLNTERASCEVTAIKLGHKLTRFHPETAQTPQTVLHRMMRFATVSCTKLLNACGTSVISNQTACNTASLSCKGSAGGISRAAVD